MAKKFTFKNQPRMTGLSSVGYPNADIDIKLNGKAIGMIVSPCWSSPDNLWRVRFTVKSKEDCGWKWVTLKKKHDNGDDAKKWLNESFEWLNRSFDFHELEE